MEILGYSFVSVSSNIHSAACWFAELKLMQEGSRLVDVCVGMKLKNQANLLIILAPLKEYLSFRENKMTRNWNMQEDRQDLVARLTHIFFSCFTVFSLINHITFTFFQFACNSRLSYSSSSECRLLFDYYHSQQSRKSQKKFLLTQIGFFMHCFCFVRLDRSIKKVFLSFKYEARNANKNKQQ